ncbi:isoaspartyl peptidase/L-asparaginase family protein [Luteibaculum oceani]|uniref:Isoaspartyl peptidase n=1 Tax=Luteibaculum oceani TaxID=1294296 RepID=A0A5C6UX76_9FLAO|nr:isoaspartyl peptidase/L-asparaginase [Luteibaculum oceani]TXC75598.1 isoaspartyl peptidase/L-asparaginase [Luteibaculum oceani]
MQLKSILTIIQVVFLLLPVIGQNQNFGIAIHGGAGYITPENISEEKAEEYKAKLREALNAGYEILDQGGSSLDAVTAAITILEDSPLFNAGKGAVFTHEEKNELDASIMNGADKNAGAVAGVTTIRNPILAARAVMEKSNHVMLSGPGAELFAKEQGLTIVSPNYFKVDARLDYLRKVKAEENKRNLKKKSGMLKETAFPDKKFGTVGAVALDKAGNLAAGTSTGGMTNKRYGRIGDAPIIAAGTYADNNTCAVSCTGHGEYFIRNVVAYDVAAKMKYQGIPVDEAASSTIKETEELGGKGGLIAIDKNGKVSAPFSTPGMHRAWKTNKSEEKISLFKDE